MSTNKVFIGVLGIRVTTTSPKKPFEGIQRTGLQRITEYVALIN